MTLTLTTARSLGSLAHALRDAALTGLRKLNDFSEARRNRRAIHRLADHDERMLKDIGLSRSEVVGALAVSFDEDPSALLRRECGVGSFDKPRPKSPQSATRPKLPIVQGFAQGIA